MLVSGLSNAGGQLSAALEWGEVGQHLADSESEQNGSVAFHACHLHRGHRQLLLIMRLLSTRFDCCQFAVDQDMLGCLHWLGAGMS